MAASDKRSLGSVTIQLGDLFSFPAAVLELELQALHIPSSRSASYDPFPQSGCSEFSHSGASNFKNHMV